MTVELWAILILVFTAGVIVGFVLFLGMGLYLASKDPVPHPLEFPE